MFTQIKELVRRRAPRNTGLSATQRSGAEVRRTRDPMPRIRYY
jgi:hypothetical protein